MGILLKLARFLFLVSKKLLRKAFDIPEYKMSTEELMGLTQKDSIKRYVWYDGTITYTDFRTFKRIIDRDWTRYNEYQLENFDCDNFAMAFASHISEFWGINNVGVASGAIRDVKTGAIKGYHAWNVFVVETKNGPRAYVYEPQTGMFTDYKHSRFGDVVYEPDTIVWW